LVQSTLSGDTSVGQTTFYLATVLAFGNATQSLFTNLARARQELMQISSVFEFLDVVPAFSDNGKKLDSYEKAPSISFKNVSFGYSPDKSIVNNINFEINPGEKVALVGLNGAGKSTIVKLLCRVYDPQSGEVLIDGTSLSEINPDSWYQNLSVVFQDYGRYEFTVEESIAIGERGKIDEERVRRSAVMAQIDEKIQSFPEGYKNQLGTKFPGGVGMSVGQWQKIAIARALYRQSRVIILDEPTSSIDADAEEEIFNTLHNLGKDTTLIFVSHRFSTIRQADKIVFIAGGTVDCVGSHDYLIENSSEYRRLYEMQSRAYSE
jgi:ATP-binding cassette, subfamily B, bacterial